MSGPFRVWLLQIPADGAEAWRSALSSACADAGWDFAVHNRHAPAPAPHPERSMLVVSWLHHVDAYPVTHYLVQGGAPAEAAAILAQEGEPSRGELLRDISLRYAVAHFLTDLQTPFTPADATVMTVPGLGDVHCSPDRTLPSSGHPEPALDVFERLPIPIGAQAAWGPELFDYADAGAESRTGGMSLVGRRRLLFNGPHIHLPKGVWRFEGSFSIDPGGDADLLIEWGYGHDIQALPVVIGRAGRYEVVLEQAWSDVMNADFRISLMTPLLEGTMTFHGGTVTRLPDAPAEAG